MAIDMHAETLLTLRDVTRFLPGKTHISTVHRWRLRGVRGVRLETCLIGGRRYTSREALARFVAATTAAAASGNAPDVSMSKARARAVCQAETELDQAGI